MHRTSRALTSTFVVAIGLIGATSTPARAAAIVINPDAGLAANASALAAFNRAATYLGSMFSDAVTVNIAAGLSNAFGNPNIIGSASSTLLAGSYSTIRNAVVADAANEPTNAIVASLPTAAQFSAFIPSGFSLNGAVALTSANAKALGFAVAVASDGTITFNSNFAFDYDNSDGVGAGLIDFETVALHEIAHTLGFISWVDQIDGTQPEATYLATLDLFRFPASGAPTTGAEFTTFARSLVPGAAAVFSDTVNAWRMSTGVTNGDGRQASHWRDDALSGVNIGMMDPTLATGVAFGASYADLRALDLIGWDLRAPQPSVPEPASLGLLVAGMALVLRRRTGRVS